MAAFALVDPAAVGKSINAMGTLTNIDLTKMADTLMNPPSTEQPKPKPGEGKGKWVTRFGKETWIPEKHQGGPIFEGGLYRLLPNEMVLDNQAVAALAQALTMVTMSQENAKAGGGNTTIISAPTQPITNLAQNSTNINQINVPESARSSESTLHLLALRDFANA